MRARGARSGSDGACLSSHILSEVEAVCDRVAMLRNGRLIESGRLDVLRGLATTHLTATLDAPPPDLRSIAGVGNVVVDGSTVECDVTGRIEPILAALAAVGVQHLATHEPSLEELFVAHYGPDAASAA